MTSSTRSHRWKLGVTGLALLGSLALGEGLLRWGAGGYSSPVARAETLDLVRHVTGDEPAEDGPKGRRGDKQLRALHPYFGYDVDPGDALLERYIEVHQAEDRQERFTVLICGGSVAETFVGNQRGAADILAERLAADPRLSGRRVQVMRLARAGYKQPQQLTKLVYFLSRGGLPDVVVNIDGLNELRAGVRNLEFGVPPSFPPASHWLHLVQDSGDSAALMELLEQRTLFLDLAQRSLDGGWYRSALVGRWVQRKLKRSFEVWNGAQDAYESSLASGGRQEIDPETRRAVAVDCSHDWARCSELMNDLCSARGVTYLHLLQPTLHDEGSKKIHPREREQSIGKRGLDPDVSEWYTLLRERGVELAAKGVPFVDASRLFAEEDGPLYFDKAHFGKRGNTLLAKLIASELLTRL